MVSSLRLAEISRKWSGSGSSKVTSPTAAAAACPRGHFAAYTRDGSRFFVPIACLASDTFRELLSTAEEEFGSPGGRPIVLPCSADRLHQILAAFRSASGKNKCSPPSGSGGRTKIW
ncbi:auxin-responsive protein SAUR36-like [Oryza glaberrima]|uniref:Auxin-responsive protein n=2 Tax=Oryza TaxID=4527 RepID=A0A0D3GQW9_9ORYZ|nr:auxin-responsive protein SAUR36-like [Oryza glaberrima]